MLHMELYSHIALAQNGEKLGYTPISTISHPRRTQFKHQATTSHKHDNRSLACPDMTVATRHANTTSYISTKPRLHRFKQSVS